MVQVRLVDHLLQLVLLYPFPQLLRYPAQILNRYETRLLVVEQVKHLTDVLPRVLIRHSRRHQVQKLLKIDAASAIGLQIGDHLVDGLISGFEAEGVEGGFEF